MKDNHRTTALLWILGIVFITMTTCITVARFIRGAEGNDISRPAHFGTLTETHGVEFNENITQLIQPGKNLPLQLTVDYNNTELSTVILVSITPVGLLVDDNMTTYYSASPSIDHKVSFNIDPTWQFAFATDDTLIYYALPSTNTPFSQNIIANNTVVVSNLLKHSELDTLEETSIHIEIKAVQADGFATIEDAYNAVFH